MKRIIRCPNCGRHTDFCSVGHSLCFECGWQNDPDVNCDTYPKEDIIKRWVEMKLWAIKQWILEIRRYPKRNQRGAVIASPKQLRDLADELVGEMEDWLYESKESKENQKCVIGIVNEDGWSDTWEFIN